MERRSPPGRGPAGEGTRSHRSCPGMRSVSATSCAGPHGEWSPTQAVSPGSPSPRRDGSVTASIEAHFVVFLRHSKAHNPDTTVPGEEKYMVEEATPAQIELQGTVATTTTVPQETVITATTGNVLSIQQA